MATPNQIIIDSPNNNVDIQTNNNQLHIISEVCNTEVNVTQPITTVIQVATPGPSGISGTSGTSGSSGTSGIDGTSGSSGSSGSSGTSGIDGTSGSSGSSGSSGTSGIDGTSGSSGSSGSSGTSGIDGTSGSSGASIIINNNTDNYILTATGNQNEINGETNLTFDGSTLQVNGGITATSFTSSGAIINGNVTVTGTASINTLVVNQTQLSTGSNQLGDNIDDTQTLYGSVIIPTGSLTVTGSLTTTGDITTQNLTVANITASENIRIGRTKSIGGNNFGTYNPILTYWNDGVAGAVQSASFGFRSSAYMDSIAYPDIFGFGTNDLRFFTSTNGIATPSEIVRIVGSTGFVGIGETSPSAKLEIRGSGATSATTAFRVENSNTSASLTILNDGTSAFNTNHLYVSSSGNIGIGTTSPSVRLHLSQSSGTFQRVDINNANADGVNATTQYYTNTGATPDLFGATSFRLQGGTTDAFKQFQVYIANLTSPRFIINGSGNVGINTTSPNARLHISGANSDVLLIASSSTAPSALFVSGSGNVGIGTATPERRLHADASGSANTDIPLLLTSVDANNRVGIRFASSSLSAGRQHNLYHRVNTATAEWLLGTNAGETAQWNFIPRDDTNYAIALRTPFNGGTAQITTGLSQSLFSLGAGGTANQHLNISSSGNVGIGTTTPTSLLQVAGRVTSTELYITNGDAIYTTNGSVGIGTSGPTSTNRLQVRGSGATSATTAFRVENSAAAARLTILDDGTSAFNTNHLYVSSSGNVGIGLTSPLARLHISGANALRMQNTGFDTFEWFFSAGTGIGFRNVTDGTTPFFVGGTDDIGIGTTNTSARLHVSGASNSNLLRVGSPAQANILFITGSGNIGVGTTTPGVTLDVVGQIRASSTMFNSTTQTNTIQLSSATNLQFLSASVETARYDNAGWGFFNTAPTARVHISGANADNLFRVSSPSATNALFVSGSGNVGIGTATPASRLQVSLPSNTFNQSIFRSDAGDNLLAINTFPTTNRMQLLLGDYNGTATPNLAAISDSNTGIQWAGSDIIRFVNGGSENVTINASGNVGIGTTNPLSLLHISASSGNEFFRITSGSQNILNVRSGSAVFFAGTGVAPTTNFDLDVQGTGTANGGTVRFAGNGTAWAFGSVSSVNRNGTGNPDMFNVSMTGTSATLVQNPMSITFNAQQNATSGSGYTVLRVNATHATTAGTGSKLLQTWEFGGTQRSVVNITGSIGVGITTPSASIHISSSLGLPPMLTITPHDPLPTTNIPTGTFMVSASVPPRPYMWDGTSWYAL